MELLYVIIYCNDLLRLAAKVRVAATSWVSSRLEIRLAGYGSDLERHDARAAAPEAPSRTVGLPEPAEAHGDPSLFPKTVKALRNRPLQASGAAVPEAPSQTVGLPEPADGRKLSC